MGVATHAKEITVRDARLAKVTMYDLADMRLSLDMIIADQDGELTPEQEQLWDALAARFEEKVEGTALLIREREAQADMVRQEAQRLTEWAASLDGDAKRLRGLLLSRMQAFGKTEVTARVKVSVRTNAAAVVPTVELDEAHLRELAQAAPYAVRIVPEKVELNKKAIAEQAKVTGALPEAVARYVTLTRSQRVEIK